MPFNVNDAVDVRGRAAQAWYPGVVAQVLPTDYVVTLNTPKPTVVAFYGANPSRYGPNQEITTVKVRKLAETISSAETRIRAHV